MDQEWVNSFRTKLDQHHHWPSLYVFKFIVPKTRVTELKDLFPQHTTSEKASTKGNYISVTMQVMIPSSDVVIEIYQKAATVEGVIAL
jgi:putative lipoic acid-binding regulatory protein